ncbi:MAG: hypothetical protein WED33_05180 [Bacteroidia bacterium]
MSSNDIFETVENTFISIFYFLLFAVYLLFSKSSRITGFQAFAPVLVFTTKCFAAFGLVYIYSEVYRDRSTADIFKLFDDAEVLYSVFEKNPNDFMNLLLGMDASSPYFDIYTQKMPNWNKGFSSGLGLINDSRTIIKLNALIRFISFGAYGVHVIIFTFISTLGLIKLYKAFYPLLSTRRSWLFFSVFLIPSVLCWSSGVLKESLLFYLIGGFTYLIIREKSFERPIQWMYLLFIILGFIALKVYIILAFCPGVLAWYVCKRFKKVPIPVTYLIILPFCAAIVWIISASWPAADVVTHLSFIQQNMLRMAFYSDAGSVIEMQPLEPELWSYLRNLPEALINAAFRPGILDAKNSLQWFAAFENAFIVVCVILCIGLYRKPINRFHENAVWFSLSFVLVLYTIMGLSTPILGTLVRYRMPALQFLFIAMVLLSDTDRLIRIIQELFNYEPTDNTHHGSDFRNR